MERNELTLSFHNLIKRGVCATSGCLFMCYKIFNLSPNVKGVKNYNLRKVKTFIKY